MERNWNITKVCYKCKTNIEVKYNRGRGELVKKNNLGFWTENEEDVKKYVCDYCFLSIYFKEPHKFNELVKNAKKRKLVSSYISLYFDYEVVERIKWEMERENGN
jgi:hypothetical protein